ncbi:MAG: YciI family protein [Proteobacteria bacterium]|nr:YciI family protein [Pseudomonadota bacterium]
MLYMLLIYANEAAMPGPSDTETYTMLPAYAAYAQAMTEAGVRVAGDRLRPTTAATTVRTVGGKTQVLDGPYAETKEQLGGYFLIDVPDLDAALAWAQRCPGAAVGAVEIRPIWPHAAP